MAQVAANPASVPGRFERALASDPAPIPKRATARINPNVYVDPPRRGPSIRYQTSSISVKTNPVIAAAPRTNLSGTATVAATAATGGSGVVGTIPARLSARLCFDALFFAG